MLTLIFIILLLFVFEKLLKLSMKATWGILKFLFTLVFLPITLIGLVIGGLIHIAFPILVIIGIVSLISGSRA